MLAEQRRADRRTAAQRLEREGGALPFHVHVVDSCLLADQPHRARAGVSRVERQPLGYFHRRLADHCGCRRLEDPRLLARDRAKRGAEILHVIEADRRHPRGKGAHDVGRIEPASESGLDEGDVGVLGGEVQKSHRRSRLEERRPNPLDRRRPAFDERDDLTFRDRCAGDDDPFPEIDEMWRGVSRDAKFFRAEQRVGRRDGTALSVRAGDVQRGNGKMGISHLGQQRSRAIQAELERAGRAREQEVERGAVLAQGDVHPDAAGFPLMCRRS